MLRKGGGFELYFFENVVVCVELSPISEIAEKHGTTFFHVGVHGFERRPHSVVDFFFRKPSYFVCEFVKLFVNDVHSPDTSLCQCII